MADPAAALLLFDCVLGYGSHPDPAGVLADGRRAGAARARRARRSSPSPRSPARRTIRRTSRAQVRRARGRRHRRRCRTTARAAALAAAVLREGAADGHRSKVLDAVRRRPRGRQPRPAPPSPTNLRARRRRAPCRWTGGRRRAATRRLLAALDAASARTARRAPTSPRPTREAVERLLAAQARHRRHRHARSTSIPGMRKDLVLHAGPPVDVGAHVRPDARRGHRRPGLRGPGRRRPRRPRRSPRRARSTFEPCHHHATVGPMAGVVTASMPVWILENAAFGNRAYGTLNEGLGKVLRYGAYDDEVLDAPALDGDGAGARRSRAALAVARAARPAQPHRPGAADGRRGAQPQPRRAPRC